MMQSIKFFPKRMKVEISSINFASTANTKKTIWQPCLWWLLCHFSGVSCPTYSMKHVSVRLSLEVICILPFTQKSQKLKSFNKRIIFMHQITVHAHLYLTRSCQDFFFFFKILIRRVVESLLTHKRSVQIWKAK